MKKLIPAVLVLASSCHGDGPTEYGEHVRTISCDGVAFGLSVEYVRTEWTLRSHTDAFLRHPEGAPLWYGGGSEVAVDVAGWLLQPTESNGPLRLIVDAPEGRAFIKNCRDGLPPEGPRPPEAMEVPK